MWQAYEIDDLGASVRCLSESERKSARMFRTRLREHRLFPGNDCAHAVRYVDERRVPLFARADEKFRTTKAHGKLVFQAHEFAKGHPLGQTDIVTGDCSADALSFGLYTEGGDCSIKDGGTLCRAFLRDIAFLMIGKI